MKDESAKLPDTADISLDNQEAKADESSQNVGVASHELSAPTLDAELEAVKAAGIADAAGGEGTEVNNGEQRSDSEAETVVLSGKDEALSNVNPTAIKHEGGSGVKSKKSHDDSAGAIRNGNEREEKTTERMKARKESSTSTVADASYSSNLSSTASSPALEERSSSKATSEIDHSHNKLPHDDDSNSKDIVSRKRKLRAEDTDEKVQQRRRKRATSSETANNSDRRDAKKVIVRRSESPPTRSRNRAQSTQSTEPQGMQKRRKPPPLQVGQRRKASEDVYVESDDSGTVNGIPRLRKLVSTDPLAMSPAKVPHKKHRDKNGRTWLARACALDDMENALARLHERPEDIDIPDHAGNTPLQIASLEGSADIVKMLLDAKCDTTCKNVDHDTPLIDAVENGHLEVVRLLLAAGLDPRISNAKGEGPLDLLKPSIANYEEIKAALEDAKGQYTGRRPSDDQHGNPSAGKDSSSIHSPRASPSLHATRSPPPHGLAPRRTARSEATRNDLLWIHPTPEELRKRAEKGDLEGLFNILNMKALPDIEAVLLAARGGHDPCLSLLIAMGQPEQDPEPLQSSRYKAGQNTPMLAAIGRGNIKVVNMLLAQSEFDPTRRFYKNATYYEIAKDRQGPNWQEEYDMLKEAYDNHMASRPKPVSPSTSRSGTSPREQKSRKRDTLSPSIHSVKRHSPDSAAKDGLIRKRRLAEGRQGRTRPDEHVDGPSQNGSRSRLRVPAKGESRESSVVVSDREATPFQRQKEKRRSFSDAGGSTVKDKEISKPKKRLVSSRALKEDEEKKRRASLASSSSSQEHVRSNLNSGRKGSSITLHETKDGNKPSPPEPVKKRTFQSISPSEGNGAGNRRGSDVPKKLKRQRINSHGNAVDREVSSVNQSGPAQVANMIALSQVAGLSALSQGAAPVAFMGNSSTSPIKERSNPFGQRTDTDTPMIDSSTEIRPHRSSQDLHSQSDVDDKESPGNSRVPEASAANIKDEEEDPVEVEERQQRERELAEQKAKEQAERDEADRVTREAEQARLEEQRRIEEAERVVRLEREAEEARIEKKRQEEETQLRLIERERLRKEEQERRRAEQEERERIMMIRRQEEEERRRRESLPNALKIAAELSPENAKHPSEIVRWLPLYTAFGYQLDPHCDEQAREERWITNIQAAPILAINDLDLSQYTAWTKRPLSESHRESLWRVLRLKLTRYERPPGVKYDIHADLAMVEETRSKYSALEHIFWIRLSDFMDIVPRYPHLAGIPLNCGPLALIAFDGQLNGLQLETGPLVQPNGHPLHIPNGQLTNGYH